MHDYSKFFEKTDDKWLRLCIERDIVLQITLEKTIADAVRYNPEVLSLGLRIVWPEADPCGPMLPSQNPTNRWYEASRSRSSMLIHFNIATGSLLVGSKPLSILPEIYTQQDLYKQVLNDKLMNVLASDDPKMEYMTVNTIEGYQLYFGFTGSPPALQIYAKKDDLHFVAILRTKFGDDLPQEIIEFSVPWLCVNTSCIELRNMAEPWCSSKSNCKISLVHTKEWSCRVESEESFLIDNNANVGSTICSVLSPLEMPKHISIAFVKETKRLRIKLPRYSLSFEVTAEGQLRCIELAAIVAQSQILDTFYGLENRLVLHDDKPMDSNSKNWVLIPFGDASVKAAGTHVSVNIDIDDYDYLTFYKYRVDPTLKTLIPDQVEGYLWKAYLHACTSSCLPDKLTGSTGIEEAFRTLDDSLLQTCVPFTERSTQILERLAHISTYRSFYPSNNARHMQQTCWNENLSFMVQHDGFHKKVYAITSHNLKSKFLHENSLYVVPAYRGNDKDLVLAKRAMYAWRKYWPNGFTSGRNMSCGDKFYDSRDMNSSRDTGAVFEIAAAISAWDVPAWTPCDFYALLYERQVEASPRGLLESLDFSTTFRPLSLTQLLTLDIKTSWTSLLKYCLNVKDTERTELLFTMSMIVFGNPNLLETLKILLPFAILPELKAIGLPSEESAGKIFGGTIDWNRYDLSQGESIEWTVIDNILDQCRLKDVTQDRNLLAQHDGPADGQRPDNLGFRAQSKLIKRAVAAAWLEKDLRLPEEKSLSCFQFGLLQTMLIGRLGTWMKNSILWEYCNQWEKLLGVRVGSAKPLLRPDLRVSTLRAYKAPRLIGYESLLDVMQKLPVDDLMIASVKPTGIDGIVKNVLMLEYDDEISEGVEDDQLHNELQGLIVAEFGTQDKTTIDYREGLSESHLASKVVHRQRKSRPRFPEREFLRDKHEQICTSTQQFLEILSSRTKPRSPGQEALRLAGLWPTATAPTLLQLISKSHRDALPDEWRSMLVKYAREMCSLQRITRIVRFQAAKDQFAFNKEVDNTAHETWNPGFEKQKLERDMDWLLFEIQNDMLIRPIQVEVALAMIESTGGVLQLQMGDGKSSVILPLFCMSVAAPMEHLVRVVVLKSLAKETIASLSKSLSGLVQTPLYWLPFSRSTTVKEETATQLRDLWKECRSSRGILLALPEHLNSFRLIGKDQLTAGRLQVAQRLLAAQKFLDNNSRDIIDESDEVLKPAYELVYTNGAPRPLSGAPYRWDILLSVLDVIQARARDIHLRLPDGLEYKLNEQGAFATVRILTTEAKDALLEAVLQAIFAGAIPTLSFENCDSRTILVVSEFICSLEVGDSVYRTVTTIFQGPQEVLAIHLLRGLFAWDFLAAAFEKRFFVNYGLDRTRCLSAVPYRSKGVPATAAEFAQPEMSSILTALAHHYTGLGISDMRQVLTIMLRLPDPSDEYGRWTAESVVPERIRRVASINLQDDECIADMHKHLSKCKSAINFFLRSVVLPTESKEYTYKLSSSAWDLCAGENRKVTAGFSGTCDSLRCDWMKPIKLEKLLHFDADVLISLLKARNRRYVKAHLGDRKLPDTEALLRFIEEATTSSTSVLVDVGAQFLDNNQTIAEKWLHIRNEGLNPNKKLAAVFFDDQDEKQVVTPNGSVVAWQSSPYKEQMSSCLLILDEHHCRGTDFVLPDDFAAALMLGPRLPKDAFVQAAMRLRKLSESQSIVTFAPPEVDNDIRALLSLQPQDAIDIADVIKWVVKQSCDVLRVQETLRILRHLEWLKRSKTTLAQVCADGKVKNRPLYIDNMLQQEVNKVEELYGVGVSSLLRLPKFTKEEMEDEDVKEHLKKKDQIVNQQVHLQQSKDKEQEQQREQQREQQHEREAEREVQRLKEVNPKIPDVNKLLEDIIIRDRASSTLPGGLVPAFGQMSHTSLYQCPLWKRFPALLVATRDYLDAVKSITGRDQDDFLRPVHWVLKLESVRELILIGPHEAQRWIPYLRRSKNATLISYAAKTIRDMVSFDNLDVYTVPERVVPVKVDPNVLTLLRLFAGQLYFNTFEEYERFCRLLSIRCAPEPGVVTKGLSARRTAMLNLSKKSSKTRELVPIVRKWIDMRRKGIEWGFTDVGRVLNGEVLSAGYFR